MQEVLYELSIRIVNASYFKSKQEHRVDLSDENRYCHCTMSSLTQSAFEILGLGEDTGGWAETGLGILYPKQVPADFGAGARFDASYVPCQPFHALLAVTAPIFCRRPGHENMGVPEIHQLA